MAKFASSGVLDGALQTVAGATHMLAVAGQPADAAAAQAGKLAEMPMAAGDFVITSTATGRRLNIVAKAGAPVLAAGTADHIALVDAGAGRLLYVTTCGPRALSLGHNANFAAWRVEIGLPV